MDTSHVQLQKSMSKLLWKLNEYDLDNCQVEYGISPALLPIRMLAFRYLMKDLDTWNGF